MKKQQFFNTLYRSKKESGFTLVELMIALVVAFLVIGAIYATYIVQQRTQTAQMQVTEVQQNLRAAMDIIGREFRLAGYDPDATGDYGIITANKNTFSFTGDVCENGGLPTTCAGPPQYFETYSYEIFDTNGDGVNDAIRRVSVATDAVLGLEPIAENIERLDFRYIMDTGVILETPPPGKYDEISGVIVSILARAEKPDFNFVDINTYEYANGLIWNPGDDATFPDASCGGNQCENYRRRSLVQVFELRNMGLI